MSKSESYHVNWSVEFIQVMPDERMNDCFERISPNVHPAKSVRVTWHSTDTFNYISLTSTFNFNNDEALLVKINEDHIQMANEVFRLRFEGNLLDKKKSYHSLFMSNQIGYTFRHPDRRGLLENERQKRNKKDQKSCHPVNLRSGSKLLEHCSFSMDRSGFEREIALLEVRQRDRIRVGLKSDDPSNVTQKMKGASLLKKIGTYSSAPLIIYTFPAWAVAGIFVSSGIPAGLITYMVIASVLLLVALLSFLIGTCLFKKFKSEQDIVIDKVRQTIVEDFRIGKPQLFANLHAKNRLSKEGKAEEGCDSNSTETHSW